MASSACIASTIKHPGPSVASFVQYHLGLGFERMYLFFDDENDPWISRVPNDPRVKIVRSNAGLRAQWSTTHVLYKYAAEVAARQALNASLALEFALQDSIDWLLHIDVDEALCLRGQSLADHLSELEASGIDNITYLNHEVVVDNIDTCDYFRDLRWFKLNPFCVDLDTSERALRADSSAPLNSDRPFYYYSNGKSAVRVRQGVVAFGAHLFRNSANEASQHSPRKDVDEYVVCDTPCILHYMNAGISNFLRRYRAWGDFADKIFDGVDRAKVLGTFDSDARDLVRSGTEGAIRDFYQSRVVATQDRIAELRTLGLVREFPEVATLLATMTPS